MAVNVTYEIGESHEYADTPLVYRVVTLDGAELSRDYATFEEIAANEGLEDEYLAALSTYFTTKVGELFTAGTLSGLDSLKISELNNCTTYLLQRLASLTRTEAPSEG